MTDHVHVRPALPQELPQLLELTGDAGLPDHAARNAGTRAYLAGLLEKDCTRPEWCFVAESGDGRAVGSAVLWSLPGQAVPDAMVLFEAPWQAGGDEGGAEDVGAALLAHLAARARALGTEKLLYVIDTPVQPPQFQHLPDVRAQVLGRAGFEPAREGRRFRWRAGQEIPAADERLTFRGLPELGAEPFVELLARLLPSSADQRLSADVAELGPHGAAELLLRETAELEHDPAWFEIGFTADGAAAAVSLPAKNPNFPVIGFIGVGPDHRGQGFSTAALARSTRVLAEHGATEIQGDCDATNRAMYQGFLRAGYENFADRRELIRRL